MKKEAALSFSDAVCSVTCNGRKCFLFTKMAFIVSLHLTLVYDSNDDDDDSSFVGTEGNLES